MNRFKLKRSIEDCAREGLQLKGADVARVKRGAAVVIMA